MNLKGQSFNLFKSIACNNCATKVFRHIGDGNFLHQGGIIFITICLLFLSISLFICLFALHKYCGLKLHEKDQKMGLDITSH